MTGAYNTDPYPVQTWTVSGGEGENFSSSAGYAPLEAVGGASASDVDPMGPLSPYPWRGGSYTEAFTEGLYSYHAMWAWAGANNGNPDHPITSASVRMSVQQTPGSSGFGSSGIIHAWLTVGGERYDPYWLDENGNLSQTDQVPLTILALSPVVSISYERIELYALFLAYANSAYGAAGYGSVSGAASLDYTASWQ
jgi:hypothetical protein